VNFSLQIEKDLAAGAKPGQMLHGMLRYVHKPEFPLKNNFWYIDAYSYREIALHLWASLSLDVAPHILRNTEAWLTLVLNALHESSLLLSYF
jgi:hypothetical protein